VTVLHLAVLVCDGCGTPSRHVQGSAEEARVLLWQDGWRRNGSQGDRCPTCSPGRVQRDYLPGAPPGLCDCGCGRTTPVADRSRARSGWVKGEPIPRIPGHRTPAPLRVESGCLLWQGRVDAETGYGRLGAGQAHRVLWERTHGPVPLEHELDHLCQTPLCVELTHLDSITAVEHYARTHPRGETCGRGHTDWRPRRDGGRYCRQCNRDRDAERRQLLTTTP